MPATNFWSVEMIGSGFLSWDLTMPNIQPIAVEIKSNGLALLYPGYSSFKIKTLVIFPNTYIPFVFLSGDNYTENYTSGEINPATASLIHSNINFTLYSFLATGKYPVNVVYQLYGIKNGTEYMITAQTLALELTITGGPQIKTDKDLYTLYYNKSNNTIAGETHVNIINNDGNATLDFEGDGQTLTAVSGFTSQFDLVFNSNVLLPASGEYTIVAFLRNIDSGNPQRIYPFKIKIIIIDAEVVVSPQALDFEVRKSTQEIKTLSVSVVNTFGKSITISAPNWLVIAPASGNSNFDFTVSNINPANLAAGIITGNIQVKYDAVTILIPVQLRVLQFFTHNILDDYNFCLDNKVINVYKNLEAGRFVRITATMKFRTPTETKELIIPYIIPYFNDQVTLEIGKKIHRYFLKNHTSIFEEGTIIYNFDNKVHLYPCEASFKIEELDINQVSIYEESFSGIKLYPGKKPKFFPFMTNFGIRSRVYNSKHIFSFISGLVTAEELFDINVTKNGLEDGCIARVKVERWENKITFASYKDIIAGGQTLSYYNIDEGKDTINVQWENQNLSPESFTFKGLSNKPKDYTHLFQDNIFTGESEKFDTTVVKTINVSTGFILKSEEAIIDEIMFSKFCILEFNGKFFKAAASSAKLVYEDISKQLIEFDLEFKINGN